jgi:hypothetical protein
MTKFNKVGICLTKEIEEGNSNGEIRCPEGTRVTCGIVTTSRGGRGRPINQH